MKPVRDFAGEVADAIAAGDHRAVARLAVELAGIAAEAERRKAKDRTRKTRNSGNSTNSAEGEEIREIPEPPAPSLSSPDSPTPPYNPSSPAPTPGDDLPDARQALRSALDDVTLAMLDRLAEQCGDQWPELDRFLLARPAHGWGAWVREFATLLTGSSYLPIDLAQACRDAALSEDPPRSAIAFRGFVAKALLERREGARAANAALTPAGGSGGRPAKDAAPHGAGGASAPVDLGEAQELVTGIKGLRRHLYEFKKIDRQGITRDDVAKRFGEDVARAFETVGERRFLNEREPTGILVRDFAAALTRARRTSTDQGDGTHG